MSSAKYRLIRKLGDGNFTAGVHLAEHLDLHRQVAVKLLAVDHVTNRDDLLREAQNMAALDRHDHVIQVLDAGDWDHDHVFIASEACLGGSLEAYCGTGLDPATACRLISDTCRGLDYMHNQGLLHLDVRPANILLDSGAPKLGDFGLARWTGNASVPHVYAPHAAPELLRFGIGTPASDQYATAMTLAHLLTGGHICKHVPPDPVEASRRKKWPPLTTLGLNVPDKLKRVIAKATRFAPADRYADVESFKRAIDGATPAVSLQIVNETTMATTDGSWAITRRSSKGAHAIAVRRNGRSDNTFAVAAVDERQALRHLRALVTRLAG